MPKAQIVVDLMFGDSGKGTIVDALSRRRPLTDPTDAPPITVLFNGGAQRAHNVCLPDGTHHTFSQFGSGTLAGASTILTKDVLVDPVRLVNEGDVLDKKVSHDPFARIAISESALVITPFHRALNRLKEKARGAEAHGSCGIGVGETARYALEYPQHALRVGDLRDPKLTVSKLATIQMHLSWACDDIGGMDKWRADALPLYSNDLLDALLWRYHVFLDTGVDISPDHIILERVARWDTIWEGAQGVLLDEDHGFHPYTTWSHTTSRNARAILAEAGVKPEVIGVMRTYGHRHGAGPFPTEGMLDMPETHNKRDLWQGPFRTGALDLVMAEYAVAVDKPDSLAVTHCDVLKDGWPVVSSYNLTRTGHTRHPRILSFDDFAGREDQTKRLMEISPHSLFPDKVAAAEVLPLISSALGRPISITSSGPTHEDKRFL